MRDTAASLRSLCGYYRALVCKSILLYIFYGACETSVWFRGDWKSLRAIMSTSPRPSSPAVGGPPPMDQAEQEALLEAKATAEAEAVQANKGGGSQDHGSPGGRAE